MRDDWTCEVSNFGFAPDDSVNKILVWGTPRIGDVVMAFPALKLIRAHVPQAQVVWLTTDYARELVELSGLADEVWTFTYRARLRNRLEFFRFRWAIRRARFDRIFIFGNLEKYRRFLGPLERTHHSFAVSGGGLRAERNAQTVMKALNLPGEIIPDPSLELPDSPKAARKLTDVGLKAGRPYLVMHPGCSYMRRRWVLSKVRRVPRFWPTDNYVRLVMNLHDALPEYGFVIVGSRQEQPIVEQKIMRQIGPRPEVFNLCGQTTLRELLQILKHAALLVCGNSGVMHLATITRTPMVGLFRSTKEVGSEPWTEPGRVRLLRPTPTGNADPMSCISVERVRDEVLAMIRLLVAGDSLSAECHPRG